MQRIILTSIFIALWTTLLSAVIHPLNSGISSMAQDSSKANSARDPEIAVQEQFEMARAADTVAAYEFFIARYPDHPLQIRARAELRRLRGDDIR